MRLIKGVALLALLATAACSVGATGLVVTLQIGGGGEAQNLSIDLIKVAPTGDVPLAGGTFKYAHRVENGDVFSVLLADDDDGQSVKVQIKGTVLDSCGSAAEAHDAKEVMVIKHQALPVTLSLTAPVAGCADGGVDMAHDSGPADLTSSRDSSDLPDLSVLDLTMPPPPDLTALLDLTPLPDLTMLPDFTPLPDLTPVDLIASPDLTCTPSCQAGVATMCVGNQPKTQTCAYGCKGTSCDPTCAAAGDISAGGTFTADTTYGTDQNAGSCNVGMGGREDVLAFTLADWSTVILTMNSIKAPELYVRQRCGDPTSEIPIRNPCTGTVPSAGCSGASLMYCSLPPGTYYAMADFNMGQWGPYSLTYMKMTSSLNTADCSDAGMLLLSGSTLPAVTPPYTGDTTGHSDFFQTNNGMCKPLDGTGAPDSVYWIALPDGTTQVTATVTSLTVGFQPIVYVRLGGCKTGIDSCGAPVNGVATATLGPIAPSRNFGAYVFVDGQTPTPGKFTLSVSLK